MVGGTISLTTNFCSDIPLDSFVVGKIKPAFLQKLIHRATKPFAYRLAFIILFYGDLAGTFNVLTYTAATSYVADTLLRRVRVRFRVTVYTQPAIGVIGTPLPLTVSAEI